MTRQMIEITFGNALTQARQLEECADDMIRVARNSLAQVESELGSAWEGPEARAYLSKLRTGADKIVKTANKLNDIAATIRRVANIFRAREIRALEIAQQRTYGS